MVAGTDWALGVRARSLALLNDREDLYQAAIEYLGRSYARVDLARAHLLYGEWLRHQNRRMDARAQLHLAHEMLGAAGAEGFADVPAVSCTPPARPYAAARSGLTEA